MLTLPVPIGTYESMVKQCLNDVQHPKGRRQRRRARQMHGARDAAILSLSYLYGASTSDLVGLEWSHCRVPKFSSGTITFLERPDRSQTLPLLGPMQRILHLWKSHSSKKTLFCRISKFGEEGSGSLTPSAIRKALKKRHNQVGRLDQANAAPTPRKLRSSFRKLLKDAGTKDAIMRDLLGLASRREAPRNDDQEDARMKDALQKVSSNVNVSSRILNPSGL